MNERDKEIWNDAMKFADINPLQNDVLKFADLIRADEREALEKIDWTALMREGSLVTRADAATLGLRVLEAIKTRGNT